ncbi:MAG: four helix bundle protein [Desulfobacteraceae bacterium]|nr:MAG: four helix bundle protein [Desulfobacteraceae bacterium]
MSYRKLGIWQEARELVIDIHRMTLSKLPKFELYEEGSQIRRSIKSTKSTIVEGYGRRRYKQDYLRFLTYALASCDETTDHLETLYETESLKDEVLYNNLHERLQVLGKKINRYIQSVEIEHRTERSSIRLEAEYRT